MLGIPEVVVVLALLALVFGPGRMQDLLAALGRSAREFEDAKRAAEHGAVDVDAEEVDRPRR